jgi:hypothetical protein
VAKELPLLPAGPNRTSLLQLLKYYLWGMRHAAHTSLKRRDMGGLGVRRSELNSELDSLQLALQDIECPLIAFPFNNNFNIPSRSVLELLVHVRCESLASANRLRTPGTSPFKCVPVSQHLLTLFESCF